MFGHLSTLMNLKNPQSPNKTDRKGIKTYALHECWYFQAGEKVVFSVICLPIFSRNWTNAR